MLFRSPLDVPDRGSPVRRRLIAFLSKQTGQPFGDDLTAWRDWMWQRPYDPHPQYAAFKGQLYGQIDPRMRAFFVARRPDDHTPGRRGGF